MDGLAGLRTLVTGGAGGIGLAVVERLAAEGARVAAADLAPPEGTAAEAALAADVTDEGAAARLVAEARDALSGLDALVLTAGIHWVGPTHEMPVEDFDRVLAVSVRGTFLCLRAALPGFVEQGQGRIVTFGSTAALVGAPGLTAYSASKGAIVGFTKALSAELAPVKIRVNCVCPGWIDTPFNQPAINFMGGREDQDRVVKQIVPMGRQGTPDEIAPMVVYLASDGSTYMTGQALVIDGGVY